MVGSESECLGDQAGGSIPPLSTSTNWRGFRIRSVALTVEHRIPNPRVGGSNPSWPVETWLRAYD